MEKVVKTTIRIPEKLLKRVTKAAQKEHRSMNYWVQRALEDRLDALAEISQLKE